MGVRIDEPWEAAGGFESWSWREESLAAAAAAGLLRRGAGVWGAGEVCRQEGDVLDHLLPRLVFSIDKFILWKMLKI